MPFMLYSSTSDMRGKHYNFKRRVSIAGKHGPLLSVYRGKNVLGETPFAWHASSRDIVSALGGDASDSVIIDLKPRIANNVSLYRLLDIWAFSYPAWTPLALRLEVLFADQPHSNPTAFKTSFSDTDVDGTRIGEFLYVKGGTEEGNWAWGQVGSVNGALLWPDAFEYLTSSLANSLR